MFWALRSLKIPRESISINKIDTRYFDRADLLGAKPVDFPMEKHQTLGKAQGPFLNFSGFLWSAH